ncbi:hypothetical protein KBP30_40910 [Streptomyces sp. Go40/10]|uniref:hypothetical protein n=1 Tax=Streptomyces sp. Go40/10 TaxID=2825844 RepID=UPI001E33A826|nr:hypothetical protein [Streptomyces sp. Go40/10]UFR07110.1 hypothetical protein KBP30_40910 [Streptomyces sp. Go40/10]
MRRLITRLTDRRPTPVEHSLHWSTWRRRRQHQARTSHYKRRGHGVLSALPKGDLYDDLTAAAGTVHDPAGRFSLLIQLHDKAPTTHRPSLLHHAVIAAGAIADEHDRASALEDGLRRLPERDPAPDPTAPTPAADPERRRAATFRRWLGHVLGLELLQADSPGPQQTVETDWEAVERDLDRVLLRMGPPPATSARGAEQ